MKIDNSEFAFVVTTINGNFDRLFLCIRRLSILYPNCNVEVIVDSFLYNCKGKQKSLNKEQLKLDLQSQCENHLNISISESELRYPFVSFNHKDRCVHHYVENTKFKYLAIIDDDTFFIHNGLIEWCLRIMRDHDDVAIISEVLKPWYAGLRSGLHDKMMERFSNWFMFINVELLSKNNIHYHTYDKEEFMNYLNEDLISARIRNLNPTRDDCGFIYYQIKKAKLKIIDLNQYIFFYQEFHSKQYPEIPEEIFISNGNAAFNYYYIHIGSLWFFINNQNEERKIRILDYLRDHEEINIRCHDNLGYLDIDCW